MNKAIIIGRLGRDPEVRRTANGDTVANLSVATSERWKDKATGERKEKTEWHRVTLWGKLAEVAEQYLNKGAQVCIEGKIETRKWEKDGQERYSTEIRGNNLEMLGGGGKSGGDDPGYTSDDYRNASGGGAVPAPAGADLDDEIPW